jgi:hypothetical protein
MNLNNDNDNDNGSCHSPKNHHIEPNCENSTRKDHHEHKNVENNLDQCNNPSN